MPQIQISDRAFDALAVASRLTGVSVSEVVDRLVVEVGATSAPVTVAQTTHGVPIHAVYNGVRFEALYAPDTGRIDITSGALQGKRYKSPSAAARAVVASERPDVNSNRNGWGFWRLDDGGDQLQSIRYQ